MLIHPLKNGKIIIKYPTKFEDPNLIEQDDTKHQLFEEYIYNLVSEDNLHIQAINILDNNIDLIKAIPHSWISTEEKYESILSSGNFYVYLYKNKQNRANFFLEDEIYNFTIDNSLSSIFDESSEPIYFSEGRGYDRERITYLKLDKSDFGLYYDENTLTFHAVILFKSLLNRLRTSDNEVYNKLIKFFDYEYLEKTLSVKSENKTKPTKI